MLHSSLPRAFLAPGLSYLGYYGDDLRHPYGTPTWHIPIESPTFSRLPDHQTPAWDTSRSSTPCPLDLSLKSSPSTPRTEDTLEEDKERRVQEEARRQFEDRYRRETDDLIVDDLPRSCSVQSHSSYELISKKDPAQDAEKGRTLDELSPNYPPTQKLILSSPTHLQSAQSYHQQFLMTPQHHLQGMHAPMTPPSTPSPPQCPRRRIREDETSPALPTTGSKVVPVEKGVRPKKKHARRLKFDEDTSSPVSGTVILGPDEAVVTGDIDPAFNIVEVTEEARAELAKIENRLGPYQCKLCRQLHEDAFQLAQHRCSRIAHVEYRCPECDKRFSCPANLASHRRWHKPRLPSGESSAAVEIPCTRCEAKFTRQAALRKHLATQHPEANNNTVMIDHQETMGKGEIGPIVNEGTEMP